MYFPDTHEEWESIHPSDLWIYNKLILGRELGYLCGPTGSYVPKPDFYIVRPMMNILGMSRFARKEFIHKTTDQYHPSEFWSEIFHGDHISVDYKDKKQILTVLGTKDESDPLYKWKKWEKIDQKIEFPEILNNLVGNYEYINCELIGGRLIEVHFRINPNFRYGNSIAVPVWKEDQVEKNNSYKYIEDESYLRSGFYIN